MVKVVDKSEFLEPSVRRKVLSECNDGDLVAAADSGEFGLFQLDEPGACGGSDKRVIQFRAILGAFCGHKAVAFSRKTQKFDLKYSGMDSDAAYAIDIRGRSGVRDVVPHFQTVRVEARILAKESEGRRRGLVEEIDARCSVFNLT